MTFEKSSRATLTKDGFLRYSGDQFFPLYCYFMANVLIVVFFFIYLMKIKAPCFSNLSSKLVNAHLSNEKGDSLSFY